MHKWILGKTEDGNKLYLGDNYDFKVGDIASSVNHSAVEILEIKEMEDDTWNGKPLHQLKALTNNNVMSNFGNLFNGLCGPMPAGLCKITMNGNIAVKCNNGYKCYNLKKKTLTNVSNFCFPMDEMFFVIPTNKVAEGDIILIDKKPKCVIKNDGNNIITVIDYENSEIRQVVPERHMFMGKTYFYGKIVSMFGNSFKSGKGMGNIMKVMMFSQMFGDGKNTNGMFGGNAMQMMAMSSMFGGGNMFDGMFDGMLDGMSFDDSDDEETADSKSE